MIEIKKIKAKIKLISGLHIGAGNSTIEIGGMDNPIIRNPLTGEPYIPGSSIKGKLRSLMEWKLGKVLENNGKHCECGECDVCIVFGSPAQSKRDYPTRLIIRDSFLTEEWIKKYNEGENIIEEKYENVINRINANAIPRPIERISRGVEFEFEAIFKIFDRNDENLFKNVVLKGLKLLELDYLGGGGSRGNGKIKFIDLKVNGETIDLDKIEL